MPCYSVSVQAHVRQERDILAECSESPFMVHMVASFKDKTHIYMLMECVMGGEFFTYLKVGRLTLHWCVTQPASQAGSSLQQGLAVPIVKISHAEAIPSACPHDSIYQASLDASGLVWALETESPGFGAAVGSSIRLRY